jgi:sorting nexin-4
LSAWFTSYTTERDRTAGGKAAGGITGFFKDKINDFKGVDPEKARQERVAKLNAKVHEVL